MEPLCFPSVCPAMGLSKIIVCAISQEKEVECLEYLYGLIVATSRWPGLILELSQQARSQHSQMSDSFSSITSFLYKVYFKGVSAAQISNKKNSTGCSKGIPNIPTCLHYQKKKYNKLQLSSNPSQFTVLFCFFSLKCSTIALLAFGWYIII